MENLRILKIVILFTLISMPHAFSNAYAVSTHKNLTENIINEYERLSGITFTAKQKAIVAGGAEQEDTLPRPLNHFFDPVHNIGFKGQNPSSPEWANNPYVQATRLNAHMSKDTKLFSGAADYSWHRAIYEYVHGDKERGLKSLGHVLHLVEDLTSVPHTRNDSHSGSWFDGSSYYEDYTRGFDSNVQVASVASANSLEQIMKKTAQYTNTNFLSRDTVFGKYPSPSRKRLYVDENDYYINKRINGLHVIKAEFDFDRKTGTRKEVALDLKDKNVMSSYWEHLSKKAVESGVALVGLFFREVAKERASGELLAMNMSYNETKRTLEQFGGFGIAKKIYGSSLAAVDLADLNRDALEGALGANKYYKIKIKNEDAIRAALRGETIGTKVYKSQVASAVASLPKPVAQESTGTVGSVSGSKEAPAQAEPARAEQPKVPTTPTPKKPEVAVQKELEPIVEQAPQEAPEPEPAKEVPTEEAPPPPTPNPSPFTPGGFAFGGGGGGVPAPEPEPEPDTTAPDVTLTVAECTDSLSPDSCLLLPGDINISWSSAASDLDYYEFAIGNATSTHSATSTAATSTIADGQSVALTITAYDTSGNSASASQSVSAHGMPVVINEVAWSDPNVVDWVELYNNTAEDVALEGWVLQTASASTTLSSVIVAGGYKVVENLTLSDAGELLELKHGVDLLDSTNVCSGTCPNLYSTERYSTTASGASNWAPNNGAIVRDLSGVGVLGTPGFKNSISHQIVLGVHLTQDKTLTRANSPYLVTDDGFTVDAGVTLTVGDGVTVKVEGSNTIFNVEGTLNTAGTSASPVVFTSLLDDTTSDGDLAGDGASVASAGSWGKIQLTNSNSSLQYTNVSYAQYGLYMNEGVPTVANSTFSNNNVGIGAYATLATISNNTFTDNVSEAITTGGDSNGLADFKNNTGSGNGLDGILISGGPKLAAATGTSTMYANSLPYILGVAGIVPSGGALTFEPGTVIKAKEAAGITIGGALTFAGTSASDLLFTSTSDSVDAGWHGINVDGGSLSMSGFTLRYAGKDKYGIKVTSASATTTISSAVISNNDDMGIDVQSGTLELSNTTVSGHDNWGVHSTVPVNLNGVTLSNNGGAGITLESTTLNAQNVTVEDNGNGYYGGIYLYASSAKLSELTFSSNNPVDIYGKGGSSSTCVNCGAFTEDIN